jgi:hypothetical protein
MQQSIRRLVQLYQFSDQIQESPVVIHKQKCSSWSSQYHQPRLRITDFSCAMYHNTAQDQRYSMRADTIGDCAPSHIHCMLSATIIQIWISNRQMAVACFTQCYDFVLSRHVPVWTTKLLYVIQTITSKPLISIHTFLEGQKSIQHLKF